MTVTLSVANVVQAPRAGYVAVSGVMFLDGDAFRILQRQGASGYVEDVGVDIDDAAAAAGIRAGLSSPSYLGPALLEAECVVEGGAPVLRDVISVMLGDIDGMLHGDRSGIVLSLQLRPALYAR